MIRLTLGHARSSSLPGVVGLCAADLSGVAAIVNEAQERLIMDPLAPEEGWWGGWARMVFTVSSSNGYAYITTPQNVARLLDVDVCRKPVPIRNGFYEFLQFSAGLQPRREICNAGCGCDHLQAAFERDNVPTLRDQTVSPCTLRFYLLDPADTGRQIIAQGTDANGLVILSTDSRTQAAISGETIVLDTPFVDSTYGYKTITGFQKMATVGVVQIYQVDLLTGVETLLSAMDPNETTAWYRRYMLNNLPSYCCNTTTGTVQVTAQARFDFIPAISDTDYLCIQSIAALTEEAQAIKYSRVDSKEAAELSAAHHNKAISILNGQLDMYQGKTQIALKRSLFGSARLHRQPV